MRVMRQAHIIKTGGFDLYCITVIGSSRGSIANMRIFLMPVNAAQKGNFAVNQQLVLCIKSKAADTQPGVLLLQ